MIVIVVCLMLLCTFFFKAYRPYITAAATEQTNLYLQKIINNTVAETLKKHDYSSFVKLSKDVNNKITGIETDTVRINEFTSDYMEKFADNLEFIDNQKIHIPLWVAFNNPIMFGTNRGIPCYMTSFTTLSTKVVETFESTGINQTIHILNLKVETAVVIIAPSLKINHVVSTTIPIAQTVIVGDVPQTYTNVSTGKDKLDDTVLQLAGN